MAFAAGVASTEFADGDRAEAAAIVRSLFDNRAGAGMNALANEQRLAESAADARFTRLRALTERVLGAG